jgi:UDP-N-acetylmuramoyl-L-alanyl-D-glutamate--2,6-diaminopimelate ligase
MITNFIPQKIKNLKHYFVAHFYNNKYLHPSRKLQVIGVTGSDGKTTTANLIYLLLKSAGLKVGLISTINVKTDTKEFPLAFHVTNPPPQDLQKFLHMMVKEGLEYVVLETTSHGLDQHRVAGIDYTFATYTNVSHEHLDYHKTYENYLKTKGKLIRHTKKEGIVILNKDDQSFNYLFDLATVLERKIITYGFDKNADMKADEYVTEDEYMNFKIDFQDKIHSLSTNLKGRYNISNIMAAIAVATELGVKMKDVKKALKKVPQLEGRWEVIKQKPYQVIIDFAHTPNALENALKRGDSIKKKGANLIVVFGCAGKRDNFKRPKMGKVAAKYADITILTAEDPRGEDIEEINKQIIEGFQASQHGPNKKYFSIPNRKAAIKKALNITTKDDIVIITGKGHEKSMNLDGKKELPWDDKQITLKLLKLKK